jgi:CubicO group peptidase (beta-lactamase class C family)
VPRRVLRIRASVLAPVLALASGARALPAQAPSDAARQLDAYVAKAVKDWNVAGLAIAVVWHDRVVFAKGYGVREIHEPAPVDTQTLFAIASTSKAMTVAALGMLVDEGKLRWDDPVTKYLPEFEMYDPWVTRELTVRDLLTHRAGLPSTDFLWTSGDTSRREIMHRVRFAPPSYSFRAGYTYQNVMFLVAGMVVEAASGMTWDDFIRTRLFAPLAMSRSVTSLREAQTQSDVASPHWIDGDSLRVIGNSTADGIGPAGGVWSSVADMAKWVRFLLDTGRVKGRSLLSQPTWEEIFRPQQVIPSGGRGSPPVRLSQPHWRTYGLGWFQQDYRGHQVDFHTGSLNGMIAIAGLIREAGLGVYVLGNTDHRELRHALMLKVFDLFLGYPARDWSSELLALYEADDARADSARQRAEARRVPDTHPSLPLERYAGTFADSLYGTVRVTAEDGSLRLHVGASQDGTLEHWQFDTFHARWDDWWRGASTVSFIVEPSGSPDRLEIGGHTLRRVRVR